jgi:hypothetical protein
MSRLEFLRTELTDIEHLDRFYWQTDNPERHEKLGYLVRQTRRRDIIAELLNLMQGTGQSFLEYNSRLPPGREKEP